MTDPLAAALAAKRAADAEVAAAVGSLQEEFAAAKAARRADPDDPDARAAYAAARDRLQAWRAEERADRAGLAVVTEG